MGNKGRLLWIDLLRIISMLMVLILHICLQGGVLYNLSVGSTEYFLAWLIESFCYCAVNCYAIITGYVMYNPEKKFNYSRIIPLWLQVFFYCLCISLLFGHFSRESFTMPFFNYLTPVLSNIYWYFTSYFGMFFFIPFINILVDKLDKKQFTLLAATMFVLFSFVPFTFTNKVDPFLTGNGYSTLWLTLLYFAGAYIRRFGDDFNIRKSKWTVIYAASSIIPCVISFALDVVSVKTLDNVPQANLGGYTYNYTSPFTVVAAVALFMLFKDMKIENKLFSNAIKLAAPASFGVYLIHVHPLVFDNIVKDRFEFIAKLHPAAVLPAIIGTALLLFIVLSGIDYVRILLFRLFRIKELSDSLFNSAVGKIKTMKLK